MSTYTDGADKRHDDGTDEELPTIPTLTPPSVRVEPNDDWFPTELLQQARDAVSNDDSDIVTVEREGFEVSKSMLQATLWNARTGDPLTDVYAPAGETDVAEIEVEKTVALGDNKNRHLAPDAGRGIVNIQIEATMTDEPEVLGIHVRTEERHSNADSRPRLCECESGNTLPCRSCFVEGFNTKAGEE